MEKTPSKRQLFGGEIVLDLPDTYIDASQLREIPDHQEVFVSSTSNKSIILEVLEAVGEDDPEAATKAHFANLAHDNFAQAASVLSTEQFPTPYDSTPPHVLLTGIQEVAKFNELLPDKVLIFFAVYRIKHKGVDLVLSANIPSSSETSEISDANVAAEKHEFARLAVSLEILDYSLFA